MYSEIRSTAVPGWTMESNRASKLRDEQRSEDHHRRRISQSKSVMKQATLELLSQAKCQEPRYSLRDFIFAVLWKELEKKTPRFPTRC